MDGWMDGWCVCVCVHTILLVNASLMQHLCVSHEWSDVCSNGTHEFLCPYAVRCVWNVSEYPPDSLPLEEEQMTITSPPPHQPLPPAVIDRLRTLAKKPRPLLRPSTRFHSHVHVCTTT